MKAARLTISIFILTSGFLFQQPSRPIQQTVNPSFDSKLSEQKRREETIEQIKAAARRHCAAETAMQTGAVLAMFQDNKVGLTPSEIGTIYELEYNRVKSEHQAKKIVPSLGWIVAFIFFLLLIVRDTIKEWLSRALSASTKALEIRAAGSMLFRRIALRRYLHRLGKERKLHIPFRPSQSLDLLDIFVPLKISGDSKTRLAVEAVAANRRLLVTGKPGAGKSVLLRYLALKYARPGVTEDIPVFLQLEKTNNSDLSLFQHIGNEFTLHGFLKPDIFVLQQLQKGRLLLLFDGLDEVSNAKKQRVVQEIRDLCSQYEMCRIVITSRTNTYQGELSDIVDGEVEIGEFRDQDIRAFLRSWEKGMPEGMPDGKSVEHLMQSLHDRPSIMALARTPLLLTIIAYLYTDSPQFSLPHSRSEFYKRVTDVLLGTWHEKQNSFPSVVKRAVLGQLALFNQERVLQASEDRMEIEFDDVVREIRRVLPPLGLAEGDAVPVLNEIVDRTSLLLRLDGGKKFQFAHQTLQEFFAAEEMDNKPEELLAYFDKDPNLWLETIKLWCGMARDSAPLIKGLYSRNRLAAFECVAEAQRVDSQLRNNIISEFKPLFGGEREDSLIVAFATVASSQPDIGKPIFEFLVQTLRENHDPARRIAAANALSLSNLQEAANILASMYTDDTFIRAYLTRLGDLAVEQLSVLAKKGYSSALDDLAEIGTPRAAISLVPFLWNDLEEFQMRTAWHLATLCTNQEIRESLDAFGLTQTQKDFPWIDWIWEPFRERSQSSLPIIAGRIAFLLNGAERHFALAEGIVIEPRIAIPLLMIGRDEFWEKTSASLMDNWQSYLKKRSTLSTDNVTLVRQFVTEALTKIGPGPVLSLLQPMPQSMQFDIIRRMIESCAQKRLPIAADWINVSRPSGYRFSASWQYFSVLGLTVVVSWLAAVQSFKIIRASQTHAFKYWCVAFIIDLVVSYFLFIRSQFRTQSGLVGADTWPFDLLGIGLLIPLVGSRIYGLRFNLNGRLANVIIASAAAPAMVVLLFLALRQLMPNVVTLICFSSVFLTAFGLAVHGMHEESLARSPLYGVIKDVERAIAARGEERANEVSISQTRSHAAK